MRLQNDPRSNNLIFSKSLPPKWGKHLVKIKWLEDFTTIIWAVAKFRLSCSKQWQYKEVNPIVTCTPKESISSPGLKQQNCFLQLKKFFFLRPLHSFCPASSPSQHGSPLLLAVWAVLRLSSYSSWAARTAVQASMKKPNEGADPWFKWSKISRQRRSCASYTLNQHFHTQGTK